MNKCFQTLKGIKKGRRCSVSVKKVWQKFLVNVKERIAPVSYEFPYRQKLANMYSIAPTLKKNGTLEV
jgi:hypothetical protein